MHDMTIVEGLTAAKGAITATKGAVDVIKSIVDLCNRPDVDVSAIQRQLIELNGLIVSTQLAVTNTQISLSTALLANQELRSQLDDREALQTLRNDMEHVQDGGFCIRRSEKEKGLFVPYCPVCLGLDNKANPLVPMSTGYYSCAVHGDATYKTSAYREEQKRLEQQ